MATIDRSKFRVTQIYKDEFINPQDLFYNLENDKWVDSPIHLRDFFIPDADVKIRETVTSLKYNQANLLELVVDANQTRTLHYDHLVIGLGSNTTLAEWASKIKKLIGKKDTNIGIIGMGPTGVELASILCRNNKITLMDALSFDNTLGYISSYHKKYLLKHLNDRGVTTIFGTFYDPTKHHFSQTIFCVGNRINRLVDGNRVDGFFRDVNNNSVSIGGDCANTHYPKTAQLAYEQGVYIAKRLNGTENREFNYVGDSLKVGDYYNVFSKGTAITIGSNRAIIDGHPYIPDGVYPSTILKLYSMFCV
jgi:NADH dehydrogenase FAD-containing subunit